MTFLGILGLICAAILGGLAALFRKGGVYNPPERVPTVPETDSPPEPPKPVQDAPVAPGELLWDTPQHAFHSTRVLCDEMGLTYDQKNLICATIYGESEFNNNAVCENRDSVGRVTSIDVGLCQINSYFHTGKGKEFPSTDYVVAHPEEQVRYMIRMYQAGLLKLWVAYQSGRYAQFLPKTSRMWKLAVVA